jgi:hypothetical protein
VTRTLACNDQPLSGRLLGVRRSSRKARTLVVACCCRQDARDRRVVSPLRSELSRDLLAPAAARPASRQPVCASRRGAHAALRSR